MPMKLKDWISGDAEGDTVTNLNSHVAHDSTLMTLQSFLRNSSNVILTLAEKLLTCRLQHLVVLALYLHLKQ